MLLWKCKKVMASVTGVTSYKNHCLLVFTFFNMFLLIKPLVKNVVFEEQLGKGIKKETQLLDIFSESTTNIFSGLILGNYLNCA